MGNKRGFVNHKRKNILQVTIKDEELIEKLMEYGQRKNINLSALVTRLCRCKDNIDGLINDLEREEYELLDEDEKINVILTLKKQLKEAKNA